MPYLIFYRRGQELMRVGLDRDEVTVGRSAKAGVVVPDSTVAPVQAALVREGESWRIVDRSGKGTMVDGRSLTSGPLDEGNDITFGAFRATFRRELPDDGEGSAEAETIADGTAEAPALPRELWLLAQEVDGGRQVQVKLGSEAIVGSSAACSLCLSHPTVSARHARVGRQEGRLVLQDLGSTNGVRVNGMRVYEAELSIGARVRIGVFDVWVAGSRPAAEPVVAHFEGIISADPTMKSICAQIDRVAASNAPVIVFGETGTGKELIARAIHRRSARSGCSLIPINCGAIAHELMETELFGHEKGAFTGAGTARKGALAEADGGTIFLDEIGELPVDLQPKLLRAVELGEVKPVGASRPSAVDVRYVCATHRNLAAEVRTKGFREDLYYRLAVATLHLPPLRQRRNDLMALWNHFMRTLSPPGMVPTLSDEAHALLEGHSWPGNVRELRNVAQRALLVAEGPTLRSGDIRFDPRWATRPLGENVVDPCLMTLDEVEKRSIEIVLASVGGNKNQAAKQLGIARSTLFKKIGDYGLSKAGDEREDA